MVSLLYPVATEKAINKIEHDNVITYVVDMRSTKKEIKEEFEKTFAVKVDQIKTMRSIRNIKRAYIKLSSANKAADVALKLKLV